jgi:hypothetical protein
VGEVKKAEYCGGAEKHATENLVRRKQQDARYRAADCPAGH